MIAKFLRPLFLAACLAACSGLPTTNHKDVKSRTLEDLGLAMNMPLSFKGLSIEEEIEFWYLSDQSEEFIAGRVKYLEQMLELAQNTQYFIDTTNIINEVRITEAPWVKIGKYTSREAFLQVDEIMHKQGSAMNTDYQVLENTYFTLENGNDVLQIRYKATRRNTRSASLIDGLGDDGQVYFTTFYVVTGLRTVMIAVNHETEDFEYFVRSIRFL